MIFTLLPSPTIFLKMINQKRKKKDKPGFIPTNYATTCKYKIKRYKGREFTSLITHAMSGLTSQYLIYNSK